MNFNKKMKKNSGFTLVETVIAMGIITIMVTAFLAAFGPAVRGVQKTISAKEANRLSSSLEVELSVLRADEVGTGGFGSAFEKAYTWIEESDADSKDNMILIYQYRGDPDGVREDGTFAPLRSPTGDEIPGDDYVVQSVVRRLGESEVQDELRPGIVEGRVFFVKMTQLVFNNGSFVVAGEESAPGGEGEIIDPTPDAEGSRDSVTSFEDYPEVMLATQAEFFVMRSSLYQYIQNTFDVSRPGKPIFTRNVTVSR